MKTIGFIPARMGSSRFPGKPLEKINDKEMLLRVYENVLSSKLIDKVYITTCDKEIQERMVSFGCSVIMTSSEHQRCTSRCTEALIKIEKDNDFVPENIVMIQGDEPLVMGKDIDCSIEILNDKPFVQIVNLISKIKEYEEFKDPNTIKVCLSSDNQAIYMSRAPVPFSNQKDFQFAFKQIGIMSMRRHILLLFEELGETNLEKIESIDMLRLIQNGIKVETKLINYQTQAVDTISDIKKVEEILKNSI